MKRGNKISATLDFALDFNYSATLIEGLVELYHLSQISDAP